MSAVCVDTLFPRMPLVISELSSLLTPAGPGLVLQTDFKQETQRSTSSEDQDLLLRAPGRAGEFDSFHFFLFFNFRHKKLCLFFMVSPVLASRCFQVFPGAL